MATGNSLNQFNALANEPPSSSYATIDTRNGHPVLDFDDTATETCHFSAVLPSHYAAGGLTVAIYGMATSATSGDLVLYASIERFDTDLDSDSFGTAIGTLMTAPATSGQVFTGQVAFTNTQIDGLTANEPFRIRFTRDGFTATDTMAGDFELLQVRIRET